MPEPDYPNIHASLLVKRLGPLAMWLKERFIFTIVSSVSALSTVLVTALAVGQDGKRLPGVVPWIIVFASLIALSTILDSIADKYDKVLDETKLAISEGDADVKVADLNKFIQKCALISTRKNAARQAYLDLLPEFLVSAAASSFSGGTRATYYTLSGTKGSRILSNPVHDLQGGRTDQPERPFVEKDSPDNTIWNLVDRADTEPILVEAPDARDGVNWEKVSYKTYYTVPVKCGNKVYGVLSVNSDATGSISGSQRRALLGMARAYALTRALCEPSSGKSQNSKTVNR